MGLKECGFKNLTFGEGPLTQTGKDWLSLLGARQLVVSVQESVARPVLWNDKVPARRSRLGSRTASRSKALLAWKRLGFDPPPSLSDGNDARTT
jgi:hypothetical protein